MRQSSRMASAQVSAGLRSFVSLRSGGSCRAAVLERDYRDNVVGLAIHVHDDEPPPWPKEEAQVGTCRIEDRAETRKPLQGPQ